MDHEVFVPVAVGRLRDVLADPARVARAVPGLQRDAGTEPAAAGVAGRLKVRIAGHAITYRGSLRVAVADGQEGQDGRSAQGGPDDDEEYAYVVEGDAVEVRGGGSVKLALTLRVRKAEDSGESGSALVFGGTVTADGRLTELPADAVAAAGVRLLRRFGEGLGEAAEEAGEAPQSRGVSAVVEIQVPEADVSDDVDLDLDEHEGEDVVEDVVEGDDVVGADEGEGAHVSRRFMDADEPPAEAAHARRTMIGRSAEEVDHAPPRGRYAPVPPPEQVVGNLTLRWAAPAAALVVASAIVVGRVLRKRR
ncbi:carbon monoxide dehydrogenase subunit G [Streptomyces sp. AK08-02]|uniref:carbon monoxide dehydrogenase subunit G n=1 Tax=Streptomyces sp. AK08-02 TaxID=3028654 RepID=UPI0029B5A965|nr:carbon monoxide dehydrogenase subunit G [Streptomyces sp. AK08-02]MDX3752769.1 carbon monoxide dehydrogenase subunit G [Streptomyces sp. AK08-02]